MIISVVNRSKTITDEQVLNTIRAINRQIAEDFEPYWSLPAKLRLEGAVGEQPDKMKLAEMRVYCIDSQDSGAAMSKTRMTEILILDNKGKSTWLDKY